MASPLRKVDTHVVLRDDNMINHDINSNIELKSSKGNSGGNESIVTVVNDKITNDSGLVSETESSIVSPVNDGTVALADSVKDNSAIDLKDAESSDVGQVKVSKLDTDVETTSGSEETPQDAIDAGFASVDGMHPAPGFFCNSATADIVDTRAANPVSTDELASQTPAKASAINNGEDNLVAGDDSTQESTDGLGPKVPTAPKTIAVTSFHRNADTHIQVRGCEGNVAYFLVHKDILSAVSPAWANMLEKRGHRHVVKMLGENDDPVGLTYVLKLAHWKYHSIQDRPSIDDLYSVARIAAKFDCTFLIAPYAERWIINGLSWHMAADHDTHDEDKIMVLAWIFGEGRAFSKVLPKVVDACSLDAQGTILLDCQGNPWNNQPVPAELIELMKTARVKRLHKIMKTLDAPLHKALENNQTFEFCRAIDTSEIKAACHFQQLGSLMSGLVAAGLTKCPSAEQYLGTVRSMVTKLEEVKGVRYKAPGVLPHNDRHMNCGVKHKDAIKRIREEPIHLSRNLAASLKHRGEISGAFRQELFSEVKVLDSNMDDGPVSPIANPARDPTVYVQKWNEEVEWEEEYEE